MQKNTRTPFPPQLCPAASRSARFASMMLVALLFAPAAFGAVSLLDLNSTSSGFYDGTVTNADLTTTATWTTDATGVAAPVTFPAANGIQIGSVASDFNGASINVAMSYSAGSMGVNPGVFNVVATNAAVTMSGSANCRWSHAFTWTVAAGSTLILNTPRQGFDANGTVKGFNWNGQTGTLAGGGTMNFQTPFGCNSTAGITENMPGGVVNIQIASVNTNGNAGTYSGGFTLTAGTLNFASAGSANQFYGFTAGKNFSINGGTVDNTSGSPMTLSVGAGGYSLGGNFTFIGSSSLNFGTAAVTNTGNKTITVSANTLTLGGIISGNNSGNSLTKAGAGTLVLTGANTYSGSTIVKAGKLIATTASVGGGSYSVTNTAILDVQVAAAGQTLNTTNLTLGTVGADTCSLQIDTGALGNPTAPVINATNLAVNGIVTVNLFGTALTPGTFTILTNTAGLRTGGGSFALSVSPRINATLTDDTANNRVTITINTTPDSAIVWDGTASGNWDINDGGNNSWKGNSSGAATDYLEDAILGHDAVRFTDAATGTTGVNLTTTLSPASLTVSNTAATYTFTGTGKLTGAIGLTKQGSGALTLAESGGDNFSGGLSISNGTLILNNAGSAIAGNTVIASNATLQVGNNSANGNVPGTVANNGLLVFNRNDSALSVSGTISGTGAMVNNGGGTVTVRANNSFSGGTTVNGGILQVSGSGGNTALGAGDTTVNAGATLIGTNGDAFGYSGHSNPTNIFVNGGIITDLGTSSYRLTLPNLTFTGGTVASDAGNTGDVNGNYSFGGDGTTAVVTTLPSSGTATISAQTVSVQRGTTTFNIAAGTAPGGVDMLVSGTIIGFGGSTTASLVKMGTGKLVLTGANTYAGNTVVSNGVLALTGSASLASARIGVTNGATFDVSSLGSPFTLNAYQTLGGIGLVKGNVTTAGSSMIDAGLYGGGALSFLNNLTLANGASNRFVLSTTTSGANSTIAVAGTLDVSAGGIVVQVSYTTLQSGRYKLFTYGSLVGSLADLTLAGYTVGGRQTAALDNSIPGEIDLVVSGLVGNLTWQGDGINNNWDSGLSQDWSNTVSHVADFYFDGDVVAFNDIGSKTPAVNLPGTVQPASILVANNSGTYAFTDTGSGKITGSTALVKQGAGALVLAETGGDDFSGGITVGGGSLVLSNNNVNISGGVTVTNGSVLLAHNGTISGGLTMDTTAGGSPTAKIVGYGTFNGGITAAGSLTISDAPTLAGNLTVNSGTTLLDQGSIPTGNATVASGATLQVGNDDYSGNLPSGSLTMNGNLIFNQNQYNNVAITKVIAGASTGNLIKTNLNTLTLSAANTFTGAVTVAQGILQAGTATALGKTNVGTTISAGATLDINGFALGGEQITVAGNGLLNSDGTTNGAINNTSATAATPAFNFITLTGNTVFGSTGGRWDLGSPAGAAGDPATSRLDTGGQPYNLTKVGGQWFGLRTVTVDPQLGDVDVQGGTFNIEGNTTGLGNPAKSLFVRNGAILEFYNMTNHLNKQIKLDDGATVISGAGTNIIVGPVTLGGSDTFYVTNAPLLLNGQLGGVGSLTKTGSGTLTIAASGNNYTGDTTISGGTLALVGSANLPSTGQIYLNTGNLDVSQESGAFTLTANTLTANTGSRLIVSNSAPASIGTFNLNDSTLLLPVAGAGTAGIIATTLNLGGTTNYVSVTVLGTPSQTQFPLVKYSSLSGTFNIGVSNILPAAAGYIGYLTNNAANSSIDLVLTGSGATAVWNGGNSGVDDNWSDALNWSGTPLQPGNNLIFGGTAGLNNTNNTAAGNVYSGITFNSGAGAFTLNGNPITLTGNITNQSTSLQTDNLSMSIAENPTFNAGTAGMVIAGGITNTSSTWYTIHLQGTNGTLAGPLQSSAAGLQNNLAVTLDNVGAANTWSIVGNSTSYLTNLNVINGSINIGTGADSPSIFITNTSTGGDLVDLGNAAGATGVLNMKSGTLTMAGTRYVQLGNNATATGIFNQSGGTVIVNTSASIDTGNSTGSTAAINVTGGTFTTSGNSLNAAFRGTGSLTVSGTGLVQCGTLNLTRNSADSANASGTVNLNAGGTLQMNHESMGNLATGQTGTFNFNGGVLQAIADSTSFLSPATAPSVFTTTVQSGGAVINDGGFAITISSPLVHDATLGTTPDGGLVKKGAGTLSLTAANTYTGDTVISNGTLAVDGSLAAGALTVSANGTLSGIGTVGGNVTVNGTIAAGTPTTTGLLTCLANVAIHGTNTMKLDKDNATNDVLSVGGTLTYGGTLNVSVLTGTLALNDSFKLFSAGASSGTFAGIIPATPGDGLAWDTSKLASNGTLSVVAASSVNMTPTNIVATVSGNTLTLTWPADHTGWHLYAQTNTLSTGLTGDWYEVMGATSVNTVNIPMDPSKGTVFYRMVAP